MTDVLRKLLASRAGGWIVAALAILALLGLWSRPRVITTTIHDTVTVEHTTTKYVESTHLKIVGGPGSKTTVYPDGHYTIEGPSSVDFTTSKSGEVVADLKKTDHQETITRPVDRNWSASFGVFDRSPYLPPLPIYAGSVGYRVIGPWWVEGHVALEPGHLPALGIQARVEWSF